MKSFIKSRIDELKKEINDLENKLEVKDLKGRDLVYSKWMGIVNELNTIIDYNIIKKHFL